MHRFLLSTNRCSRSLFSHRISLTTNNSTHHQLFAPSFSPTTQLLFFSTHSVNNNNNDHQQQQSQATLLKKKHKKKRKVMSDRKKLEHMIMKTFNPSVVEELEQQRQQNKAPQPFSLTSKPKSVIDIQVENVENVNEEQRQPRVDANGYPTIDETAYDEMHALLNSGQYTVAHNSNNDESVVGQKSTRSINENVTVMTEMDAEEANRSLESQAQTIMDQVNSGDANLMHEALATMDQWIQVLKEQEQVLDLEMDPSDLTSEQLEEYQFVLRWKLFVFKYYTIALHRLQQFSTVLKWSDQVLEMEPLLERYFEMDDDYFFDLNDVCSLRIDALVNLNRLDKALVYSEFLIDERLRARLEEMEEEVASASLNGMDDDYNEEKLEKLGHVRQQLMTELSARGNIYYLKNKKEVALKFFNEAIQLGDKASLAMRAMIYIERGKIQNAMKDAEQLLTFVDEVDDEAKEKAQLIYAICLSKEERYEEALNAFDACIDSGITTPDVYLMRSTCHYQVRDFEKALEDIKMVELLSPERTPDVLQEHINCLLYLARYDELESFCHQMPNLLKTLKMPVQEKNDLLLLRHLLISSCKRWTGDYEGALEYYRTNAEPHKSSGSSDLTGAMYDLELRILTDWGTNYQQALRVANKYVTDTKDSKSYENMEALMLRSVVLANLGQMSAAFSDLAQVEKTLQGTTDNVFITDELHFQLKYATARVLAAEEKSQPRAISMLREAIKTGRELNIRGSTIFALSDLAKLELKLGLKEEAQEHIKEILQSIPNHKTFSGQ